jgi:endonuclease/exonuclease/phosphatase family metal-dependent hydrolase
VAARQCDDPTMARDPGPPETGIRGRRWTPALLLAHAFAAFWSVGCATAPNYLDPAGPVYRGTGSAAPADDHAIRVVTFNIQFALRVDRAIVALRGHPALRRADILVLQEMDAPGVEAVARALHMNYVYYPVSLHPKHGRDFGNAVLSPWPIEESRKLLLPHASRIVKQARAAVAARIQVGDQMLQVYSLHLEAPFRISAGDRRDQAAAILADARSTKDPVVVAGDLNNHEVGAEFEKEGFAWPTKDVGASVHGFSFDHVFVRGLRFDRAVAGVARDVKDASDHRPVWVDLRMPPARSAREGPNPGADTRLGWPPQQR